MAYTKFTQTGSTTSANLGFEIKLWGLPDEELAEIKRSLEET